MSKTISKFIAVYPAIIAAVRMENEGYTYHADRIDARHDIDGGLCMREPIYAMALRFGFDAAKICREYDDFKTTRDRKNEREKRERIDKTANFLGKENRLTPLPLWKYNKWAETVRKQRQIKNHHKQYLVSGAKVGHPKRCGGLIELGVMVKNGRIKVLYK